MTQNGNADGVIEGIPEFVAKELGVLTLSAKLSLSSTACANLRSVRTGSPAEETTFAIVTLTAVSCSPRAVRAQVVLCHTLRAWLRTTPTCLDAPPLTQDPVLMADSTGHRFTLPGPHRTLLWKSRLVDVFHVPFGRRFGNCNRSSWCLDFPRHGQEMKLGVVRGGCRRMCEFAERAGTKARRHAGMHAGAEHDVTSAIGLGLCYMAQPYDVLTSLTMCVCVLSWKLLGD